MTAIRVGINGYGTIGKRITDAINLQEDMEVAGVTKRHPDYEARLAVKKGYDVYAGEKECIKNFEFADVPIKGSIEDLLERADIIVDCTPGGVGAGFMVKYREWGVKAILQGGEKHETAGFSFNSFVNFEEAKTKDYARVVSCNTTGLCRTLYPIQQVFGIERVFATLIRRSADPRDSHSGPINAVEPVLKVPSHHGPDLQTVMKNIDIQTMAVKVPTTIMHIHCIAVDLPRANIDVHQIMRLWDNTPRIKFVRGRDKIVSSAQIMELARDLNRSRGDFNEIIVWDDGTHIVGRTLFYYQAVHQESDVIPEIVDCIRAMSGFEGDFTQSVAMTDKAMGII